MEKLVQKVNWNLPNSKPQQLYMYGEASIEANQAMQEPLEKLYHYENQLDIRIKIREYIEDLNMEIARIKQCIVDNGDDTPNTNNMLFAKIQTLTEVKNDLQNRLEEVI